MSKDELVIIAALILFIIATIIVSLVFVFGVL